MSGKNTFLRGALILSGAALVSKVLGSVYTIFLQNVIGDAGMGLYNMAYPIYQALLTLSTAGLPVAVSKFVAEYNAVGDYPGARRVFRVSLIVLALTGLICAVGLWLNAEEYAQLAGDPRARVAIMAIAPALLIVPAMSAIKGYFQGWHTMEPTAVSQVVEQLVRVGTIMLAAYYLLRAGFGIPAAAAGAAFGAVTGACASLATLLYFIWKRRGLFQEVSSQDTRNGEPESILAIIRKLAAYALPVSLGALLVPLMNNVDALTVVNLLKSGGVPQGHATTLFGLLSGRAFKLMLLPATFATAIGAALMPAISAAAAVKDQALVADRVHVALRMTLLIAMPAALGMALLAKPIDVALFKTPDGSTAIAWIAAATLFSSVQVTTSSILVGLGHIYRPVVHLLVGGGVKIAFNFILVPLMGIDGAAVATDLSYLVAALLNLWYVHRLMESSGRVDTVFLRPLLAAGFMGAFVYAARTQFLVSLAPRFASERLENTVVTAISVLIGCVVYAIALPVTGCVTRNDVESVPRVGYKLATLGARMGLLR